MMNSSLSSTPAPTSLYLHFAYWPTAKTTRARSLCVCALLLGALAAFLRKSASGSKFRPHWCNLRFRRDEQYYRQIDWNSVRRSYFTFRARRSSSSRQSDSRNHAAQRNCSNRPKEATVPIEWLYLFCYFILFPVCYVENYFTPDPILPTHTHTMGAIIVSMRGLKSEDSCFAIQIDKRSVWQGKLWAMDEMCSMFWRSFGTGWADGRRENIFWRACK